MRSYKNFNLCMLTVISTVLTGCFAVRHRGLHVDMQPTVGWQEREIVINQLVSKRIRFSCGVFNTEDYLVTPSANDIRFLTWIGPPFLTL